MNDQSAVKPEEADDGLIEGEAEGKPALWDPVTRRLYTMSGDPDSDARLRQRVRNREV